MGSCASSACGKADILALGVDGDGWSEPGFGVGEIVVGGVLGEEVFECGDDLAGVVPGSAVGAGDEDHAVMTGPARGDRFVVQGAEVAEVVGDDGAVLRPGEDVGVGEGSAVGVPGDGFGVVAAGLEFAGDGGGEHLIEQEFHGRTASCPAR